MTTSTVPYAKANWRRNGLSRTTRLFLLIAATIGAQRATPRLRHLLRTKMAHSKHCKICETYWPYEDLYVMCPKCQVETGLSSAKPSFVDHEDEGKRVEITSEEAKKMANNALFHWYLFEHGRL